MKYTHTNNCEVFAGNKVIARAYLGSNGYEVRILQGMPRQETVNKILTDCPAFAEANNLTSNYIPKLFSK
jgi:hypothetical protein